MVIDEFGIAHRCHACAQNNHRYPIDGPCLINEACRLAYPDDYANTRRLQQRVRDDRALKLVVYVSDLSLLPISEAIGRAVDRKVSVVFRAKQGDVVSHHGLRDLLQRCKALEHNVEIRTTLLSRDLHYINALKSHHPASTTITCELRIYEPGFEWHHFVGRAMMAHKKGFKTAVVVPLHPTQAAIFPAIRARLSQQGLDVGYEPHPSFIDTLPTMIKMASKYPPPAYTTGDDFEAL